MRLHPPVAGNQRYANKDTVLPVGGGPEGKAKVFVKKGQMVANSYFSMHRRKDLYGEDAQDFRPERWENLKPGWSYAPFSGGPRICLGRKSDVHVAFPTELTKSLTIEEIAVTEASYVLIHFLRAFKGLECRDPQPWEERLSLSYSNRHGAKVSLFAA